MMVIALPGFKASGLCYLTLLLVICHRFITYSILVSFDSSSHRQFYVVAKYDFLELFGDCHKITHIQGYGLQSLRPHSSRNTYGAARRLLA